MGAVLTFEFVGWTLLGACIVLVHVPLIYEKEKGGWRGWIKPRRGGAIGISIMLGWAWPLVLAVGVIDVLLAHHRSDEGSSDG